VSDPRAANVLGALALAIADRTSNKIAAAAGQSDSAAAALSALYHFLDRPTLDRLRLVLGLTPSGAVRLVDRLSDAGLVAREAGGDGRSRAIVLTAQGRELAERISAARAAALGEALQGLSIDDVKTLESLMERLMAGMVNAKEGGAWICRLCDTRACERASGHCPAAKAAAAKYG
jgi:DNA-binding MarR family transcriptional regulator